jgi:hypothetical protein
VVVEPQGHARVAVVPFGRHVEHGIGPILVHKGNLFT